MQGNEGFSFEKFKNALKECTNQGFVEEKDHNLIFTVKGENNYITFERLLKKYGISFSIRQSYVKSKLNMLNITLSH